MAKQLKEEKQKVVSKWEECFRKKVSESLNEEGLKYLWDDNTPVSEVLELLDYAAVNEAVGQLNGAFGFIFEAEIKKNGLKEQWNPDEEDDEDEDAEQFRVINIKGSVANFVGSKDDVFTTIADANAFRERKALTTALAYDDMKVIKVK